MSGNNSKKIAFNYFGGKFSFIEYLHALNSNPGNAGGGLKESQTLNALDGSMSVCGSRSSDWVCNDKIKGGTCPNNK